MLHEALLVAARHEDQRQQKVAMAELLDQLPVEVLREIAETGTVKLSYLCAPDGSPKSWLEQFKGTPFFQQAIALEQEDLQAQMAAQQSQAVQRQKSDQEYSQMDQLRLKKKLLELQKARNEAQVLDGGSGPPAMAGSPDPMGTAPGAPAGPPVDPAQKTASLKKKALGLSTVGSYLKQQKDPQRLANTSKTLLQRGSQMVTGGDATKGQKYIQAGNIAAQRATSGFGKAASASAIEGADAFARGMAQADAAKFAHANEVLAIGDAAGKMLAKTAAKVPTPGLLDGVANFVKKDPSKALAIGGGVVGAAHGLLRRDGGVGDALAEGAAGAAAGHAAGGIGGRYMKMKKPDLGKATDRYVTKTKKDIQDAVGYTPEK